MKVRIIYDKAEKVQKRVNQILARMNASQIFQIDTVGFAGNTETIYDYIAVCIYHHEV